MRWLVLVCLVAVTAVRLGEEGAPPAGPNEAASAEAALVAPPVDGSANHMGPAAAAGQRTRWRSELPIDDAASPEAQQHFERELDVDAGAEEFMATSPSPEPL